MEFKIVSLNCWLLSPFFSVANKKRLSNIISFIKKYHPDIIALQEVWLKKYVKQIEDNLQDYFFIKSDSIFYNKSGLVTGLLTRNNSFETDFFPFTKKHSLLEKAVRKGYHIIKLTSNLFFINTHLYYPRNNTEKSIPKSQFNLLQKLMNNKKGILAGDLNLDKNELREVNHLFDYDESNYLTLSSSNHLTKIRFNRFRESNKRIDYILKTKESDITLSTKCIKSPIVSDHFILISDIKTK